MTVLHGAYNAANPGHVNKELNECHRNPYLNVFVYIYTYVPKRYIIILFARVYGAGAYKLFVIRLEQAIFHRDSNYIHYKRGREEICAHLSNTTAVLPCHWVGMFYPLPSLLVEKL